MEIGSEIDGGTGRMEGWLYLIRSNRFGLQYSRRRYFVLQNHVLKSFKAVPLSSGEVPVRSAIIDPSIRAMDNGRESIHRKVIFIFTLYNTSNNIDRLKLGANSPEEAARWIQAFQESALQSDQNQLGYGLSGCELPSKRSPSLNFMRPSCSGKHAHAIDWTLYSSSRTDGMTSDVVAPSTWKLFGCKDGLRLFKEAKDKESHTKWYDHPAIMAVGVIDATSEAVFQTVMSLGSLRSEWDFCYDKASVIEHVDGHTDIIHMGFHRHWLPWSMQRRDLLLRRYWRREDDGTYVILYQSVCHQRCPPKRGYVRARLKSGGYVISPINQGKQSIVKHMLAIDWKFWRSYLHTSFSRSITLSMLGRLAALREMFRAKIDSAPAFSTGELLSSSSRQEIRRSLKVEVPTRVENGHDREDMEEEPMKTPSENFSLIGFNDASDEFFDVPEPADHESCENTGWPSDRSPEAYTPNSRQHRLSTASSFVKRLQGLAVQKKGYMDFHETPRDDTQCKYGYTLPKDPTCNILCSWNVSDPSTFLIRGKTYLTDRVKIKAKGTLMEMVGADWLKSDKREDDLGGRPGGIVQKYASKGGPEFFFIVNIQVPGSTTYNLALYYMLTTPIEDIPLLNNFVNGDDAYRNSRFKLIPYISTGSWIVKQSVGKKACLIGQALEINYFRGKNYLELGVNIGSSTVARGVVSLVLGYLCNLVIEMAFLVQANTPDELPESLIGTCRLNHLDVSKAVMVKPQV